MHAALPSPSAGLANSDGRARRLAWLLIGALILVIALQVDELLPLHFLVRQDLPVLLLVAVATWAILSAQPAPAASITLADGRSRIVLLAAILVLLGVIGHFIVLHGYAFSRDEQMALQDAAIFASGRAAAAVPEGWRGLEPLLNRNFNTSAFASWVTVSDYRPVNALLHALPQSIGAAFITGPLLNAAGAIATWTIARRIWPQASEPRIVALLLYATSVQLLAISMTAYAMNALLALNTIWLALYLRGGWQGHSAALAVGFLAIGNHQIFYHAAFAFPFLCLLLPRRRWLLALLYAAAYFAFLVFWFRYAPIVGAIAGLPMREGLGSGVAQSFDLIRVLAARLDPSMFSITAANLIRFFAWQNLALLPLLAIGIVTAVRMRDPLFVAMAVALVLPVAAKMLMVPYQGHGWGYRYMHGVIPLACLLAAAGWAALRAQHRASPRLLGIATLATVLLSGPWLLSRASAMSGGYAEVDRQLRAIDADIVIVDTHRGRFEDDLVINDPDLATRPVRILAHRVDASLVPSLCARGTLALYEGSRMTPVGAVYGFPSSTSQHMRNLARAAAASCPERIRPAG